MKNRNKNILLFVGNIPDRYVEAVEFLKGRLNCDFEIAVIASYQEKLLLSSENRRKIDYVLRCDISDKRDIKTKLKNIKSKIAVIFFVFEKFADFYCEVLKVVKLKNSPSDGSIMKSVDKLKMRKAFYKYNQSITPKFAVAKNKKSAILISNKIGFPCILKPAHLSRSKLVTASYNMAELEQNLKKTFKVVEKIYRKERRNYHPVVLAEEMMEGKMYTTDAYVSSKQKIYLTPFIRQVKAKEVGINDFHIFARIIPSGLKKEEIKKASLVAKKSVFSLGLRNIAVHIELMRTTGGWKIVEVGPRLGAYRNRMLKLSYDIEHIKNYLLVRFNKKPIIKNKLIAYSAVLEFFPSRDGYIKSIKGLEKVRRLKSFSRLYINRKIGEYSGFSKNGYLNVLYVVLTHKNRKIFYNDFKKIRNVIKIITR